MNGVLVIDKPQGLTSHDVVAAARRRLGEKRIGHTGTLDPMATGVLPLACGYATRLVRFLTASDKTYLATIRFGVVTDSHDITGQEVRRSAARPTRQAVEDGIASLSGRYLQTPPAFSAKKIAGRRAYQLARHDEPVELTPVPVVVSQADLTAFDGETASVSLTCSAGFYVRTFAASLGEFAGCGATLASLRRTRSGDLDLTDAVTLDSLETDPSAARERVVSPERLLTWMPAVMLDDQGLRNVSHGRLLEPGQFTWMQGERFDETAEAGASPSPSAANVERRQGLEQDWVRLLDASGRLRALATRRPDAALHPSVVLN